MAAKSTIFKAQLQIVDLDRHHYADYSLTLARHPSETDERMMVRLLAFALHADEALTFGQGMTDGEEADLWLKELTGEIRLWIDVGLPDERLLRKACGRATQVVVYAYGGRNAELWYSQNQQQLQKQKNLEVVCLPAETSKALAAMARRTMVLQCLIQEGSVSFSDESQSVQLEPIRKSQRS
jgi:uncharacterized protein YaeQ